MRLPLDLARKLVVGQRPKAASASSGRVTQTTLERSPGNGTNTHGPFAVWNSVDTPLCGRAWSMFSVSAD